MYSFCSCPVGSAVLVSFADGTKVKVSLLPTDTASDLLDKEEVKEHLTSSAANVWLVDSLGNGEEAITFRVKDMQRLDYCYY